MLTNIISTDRNPKFIALICRLSFRDLREKKRHFIFGQTLFICRLKVHLDTELKIGLREKARQREKKSKTWLAGRSETNNFCTNRNWVTENYFQSENFTEKC